MKDLHLWENAQPKNSKLLTQKKGEGGLFLNFPVDDVLALDFQRRTLIEESLLKNRPKHNTHTHTHTRTTRWNAKKMVFLCGPERRLEGWLALFMSVGRYCT